MNFWVGKKQGMAGLGFTKNRSRIDLEMCLVNRPSETENLYGYNKDLNFQIYRTRHEQ